MRIIRGHQKRLEQWDDLLLNHALNIVATPKKGKKPDVEKMRLFKREKQGNDPSIKDDPRKAAAFLAAIKQRENG